MSSWENLSDTKECYPVENVVAQGINHEPDYNWWVGYVLRKRDCIISSVNQRNAEYFKRTHNFGIEVPKTFVETISLDENNGDTFWKYDIEKGMIIWEQHSK